MRLRNAIVTFAKKECTAVPALSPFLLAVVDVGLSDGTSCSGGGGGGGSGGRETRPLRILGHKRDRMADEPGLVPATFTRVASGAALWSGAKG